MVCEVFNMGGLVIVLLFSFQLWWMVLSVGRETKNVRRADGPGGKSH